MDFKAKKLINVRAKEINSQTNDMYNYEIPILLSLYTNKTYLPLLQLNQLNVFASFVPIT